MPKNNVPISLNNAMVYTMSLAKILAAMPAFNEDLAYEGMERAGIPVAHADRTYKFTQIAWGRFVLEPSEMLPNTGVTLSDEYFCCDAHGNVIESGQLANDPSFIAARQILRHYIGTKSCLEFAYGSADVQAVNNALFAGAKLENLVLGPSCLFMETPTDEGLKKANDMITQDLKTRPVNKTKPEEAPHKPTKPWWRFW